MNEMPNGSSDSLSLRQRERLVKLCDQLEAAWASGKQVTTVELLPDENDIDRSVLLPRLKEVEQKVRIRVYTVRQPLQDEVSGPNRDHKLLTTGFEVNQCHDVENETKSKIEDKAGQDPSVQQLLLQLYDELRQMAEVQLAKESPDQTLQPTALVHEVYLRWAKSENRPIVQSREHFFALAAEAMRHILIDNARRKNSLKRGGTRRQLSLTDDHLVPSENIDDLLALDEALVRLAETDLEAARMVRLRYYGGLTVAETAVALDISRAQAYRIWAYGRVRLMQELTECDDGGHKNQDS